MKRIVSLFLCLALVFCAFGFSASAEETLGASEDVANKELYAAAETYPQTEFAWYKWTFQLDPAIDTEGVVGDGIGDLYFRVFAPKAEEGKVYPVLLNLGGLGSKNDFASNGYAQRGASFASDANQAENPCYVFTFNMPFEACVNYEAEIEYIKQHAEIVKWAAEKFGNIDMNRIYATGLSQGAGWSYELAAFCPDLLAAVLINAGTTIHTTWGDQCDMDALAASDANLYIWHGYQDQYIPVNEAFRTFNTLTQKGKNNIYMKIELGGHCNGAMYSADGATEYTEWLFNQVKGVKCTETPVVDNPANYEDYYWAGVQPFAGMTFNGGWVPYRDAIPGWSTAVPYATWTETAENPTWTDVKNASVYAEGNGGTGDIVLAKIRIGDETATSYDSGAATVKAGDALCVTVQGYTGGYGDDRAAFDKEWAVDYAVLSGSVTGIELTNEASAEPVVRPDTVTLANGGGPNVNNSLYNENTLDGNQVYVRINVAENAPAGENLKIAIRFTRDLGTGEFASYYHIVDVTVE